LALTLVVRPSAEETPPADERELSLTLDAPRVVIGRGEGCEVRLPDPSVSHRHASIRQKGGEYVVVDEGSLNGTFLGKVRLPPQTLRGIRSGELLRVGRVWLEVRIEPVLAKGGTAAAAKEMALELVTRGLRAQGEEPWPRVEVVAGSDQGKALVLTEVGRQYVAGRGKDCDLAVEDGLAARRHVGITRKGELLAVQDLGSPGGAWLDEARVGSTEVPWRPGQVLAFGGTRCSFVYPAAEALAELERSPDERMRPGEAPEEPAAEVRPEKAAEAPAVGEGALAEATPGPPPALDRARRQKGRAARGSGWSPADAAVLLLALGVLALSAVGWWLLRR
jgi:pSer/pThr/pTyr-binding forkhead associated (FHA) protein